MNLQEFTDEIRKEAARIFPDARFIVLEDFPFYHKVRIVLDDNLVAEVRINSMNERISYALVRDAKRIAGFDNLGTWHIHPFEHPDAHRKIPAPTPQKVFKYFAKAIKS